MVQLKQAVFLVDRMSSGSMVDKQSVWPVGVTAQMINLAAVMGCYVRNRANTMPSVW